MSSFGSSLINKSGKKVVPKAAARRRPGGGSALAVQDAASVSASSSLEPSQTPQPDPLAVQSLPPPGIPTPDTTQASQGAGAQSDEVPAILISSQSRGSEAPTSDIDIPTISTSGNVRALAVAGIVRRRSPSPAVRIEASKRRRIGTEDYVARTASPPPAPARRAADDDEIPTIQISKTPPPRSTAKPKDVTSANKRRPKDGLVDYETPPARHAAQQAEASTSRRTSRPTIAPLLMATVAGPKPRAKGTRRNQWQITTPVDLAAVRSRDEGTVPEPTAGSPEVDENGIIPPGPKLRKIRKDKGIKKGPRADRRADDDEDESMSPVADAAPSRTRPSRSRQNALNSAATRGRAIAPQPVPTPPATAGVTEEEDIEDEDYREPEPSEDEATPPTGASARLKNAQKRRAKQIAMKNARSRTLASTTAAAIDDVVAQSIEQQQAPSRPKPSNPLFRVQAQEARSRSRRSSSVTTEDTESTVLTEGGTKQRKRYRRQATPPGNETVFIAEKVTPMISLVGRDTESRVGRRSTTEMRMREVDWKQVKQKQDDLMREAAIAKGNRKTNNVDVIMGIVQTPSFDVKPTPVSGDEGEGEGEGGSDDDESELARRVKMRNDIHGPSQRGTIHIVNGEHRMDETEMQGRDAAAEIDAQVGDFEPPDVDEIKKLRKFNVQTFINWKRRDPQERIYQSARWNDEETEKFYEALRCCGVDFGSMAEWFPHRIRRSLKRKFNIEERVNPERINETLDAHMMMVAHGDGGDDGTGWDLSQFHANGAGYDLRDPREVEKELEKIRAERQVEIEEARKEFEAERRNQKLAGVEHSDEEEEEEYEEIEVEVEEGEEEEGGVERVGDMITRVQKEQAEKKQKEREAAAGAVADASAEAGAEQDGNADDDDNDEDEDDDDEPANEGEVQLLEDYEEQYASGADWDDE